MGFISLSALVLFLTLISNAVNGGITISKDEEQEIDDMIKLRDNLKPVKTIKTKVGDTYNCIPIQNQPALHHPLLKNHTVQMQPTSSPKPDTYTDSSSDKLPFTWANTTRVQCPSRTVPIRRVSKEDLLRIHSFAKTHRTNIHSQADNDHEQSVAIAKHDPSWARLYGIGADLIMYKLEIGPDETSSAQMWIEETDKHGESTSLQTGWIISPALNGDHLTRLFVRYDVNGTYCYNTVCKESGFVQVDQYHPVDMSLHPIGIYGGIQYAIKPDLYRDEKSGNWWLQITYWGNQVAHIGYFPKELVARMDDGAHYVAWGGSVTQPNGRPTPPMGNGEKFDYRVTNFDLQGFIYNLKVFNPLGNITIIGLAELEPHLDHSNCYGISLFGDTERMKMAFMYGGQGGPNCSVYY